MLHQKGSWTFNLPIKTIVILRKTPGSDKFNLTKKKVGEHLVPATPYRWWRFSPFDQAEDADSSFGTPTAAWGVSAAKAARSAAVSWSRRWMIIFIGMVWKHSYYWENQHMYIYIIYVYMYICIYVYMHICIYVFEKKRIQIRFGRKIESSVGTWCLELQGNCPCPAGVPWGVVLSDVFLKLRQNALGIMNYDFSSFILFAVLVSPNLLCKRACYHLWN